MTSMYATPGTRDRFRGDGRLVLAVGRTPFVRAGPPGPARPSPEKQRPTRASAAVRGTAPHNEFFNELATQDTSSPATPETSTAMGALRAPPSISISTSKRPLGVSSGTSAFTCPAPTNTTGNRSPPSRTRRFARSAFSGNPITQRTSTLPVLKFSELACHVVPSPTAVILIPEVFAGRSTAMRFEFEAGPPSMRTITSRHPASSPGGNLKFTCQAPESSVETDIPRTPNSPTCGCTLSSVTEPSGNWNTASPARSPAPIAGSRKYMRRWAE